jgi:hypothetical protein
VLLPARLAGIILSPPVESNLKAVLTADGRCFELVVPDRNVLFDVDGPEDYQEAISRYASRHVPTDDECLVILNDICGTPENVQQHCRKVAEVAASIGADLRERGITVEVGLIGAAALLHDVVRTKPRHAFEAGRLLRDFGFPEVADIVSCHMDLPDAGNSSLEAKVVFLADKMVKDTTLVTIQQRYQMAMAKVTDEGVGAAIRMGEARALEVRREIEGLLGRGEEG